MENAGQHMGFNKGKLVENWIQGILINAKFRQISHLKRVSIGEYRRWNQGKFSNQYRGSLKMGKLIKLVGQYHHQPITF